MIICKNLVKEDKINSLDEWLQKCPPGQEQKHWKNGRSAKELAKYWCKNPAVVPFEFEELLKKSKEFADIRIVIGSPEYETGFDRFRKGRKHDLLLIGEQKNKKTVIGIEAKVDESFGNESVGEYYLKSVLKKINGDKTNITDRIEQLLPALFHKPIAVNNLGIMYQLIHATAGLLAEAPKRDAEKALFVINIFRTAKINKNKYEKNRTHLDFFVENISDKKYNRIENGEIIGPIKVPGNDYIPSVIGLYIGKIDIFVSE